MKKKTKILEDLPRPEADKLAAFYLKPGDKAPEAKPDTQEPQEAETPINPELISTAQQKAPFENLETSEVKNFDTIEVQKLETTEVKKIDSSEVPNIENPTEATPLISEVRKFDSYEVLTIRISTEHLEWLNALELKIRKRRKSLNPRITKNSIIRALLHAAQDIDIDFSEICDEDDLARRIYEVMKLRSAELPDS